MSIHNEASLEQLRRAVLRRKLRQKGEAVLLPSARPIPLVPRTDRLPLSFAQQRLWLVSALDASADRAYHLPSALRLSGSLDRDALKQALDGLLARHESLRTCFGAEGGVPYQRVMPAGQGFVWREDEVTSEDEVTQAIAAELATPFDLSNGPLIRGRLLRLSEQEHVLVLNQHHIMSDGWSSAVMVRDLAELYRAACLGEQDGLAPLPIQYVDYAHWQRQMLQGDMLQRQLDFWRGHLAGAPELLELPLDRPRTPTPSYAGGEFALTVPASLTEGLRELAQRHGATLYMVLMAAWSLLLSRLSGQSTVVVATPVAGRNRHELEELIGFFVNTVAFCTRVEEGQSVAQLIEAVRRDTLAAFDHQELPFEQVVEAVRPARSLSHAPVAQASFTWHNEPQGGALALPGLSLQAVKIAHASTQADLSLHLSDTGSSLEGALIYASDLIDDATVARWSRCFLRVLEGIVADEAQEALRVPLLPEADYREVVEAFNAVTPAQPPALLAHACFERWADVRGDAVALEFDGESISYRELDERANRVAHYLLEQGAAPDDRVALCVERGLEYVVGVLGILKAGCAYVPLDPDYPSARLSFMLNDSAPLLVLTQASVAEQLPPVDVSVLRLDVDLPLLTRRLPATRPMVPALQPAHLAYLIYTSGSTGEPKAVMVEHRQLCHLAASQAAVFGDLEGSRVLQFASPSFDASVWEWAMALLSGGTLHLAPRHRLLPGEPLLETLREGAITHVTLPGSALQALGEVELPCLRTLVVAGEPCPVALAERWRGRLAFFNAYGPTEGTVCASIEHCEEPSCGTVPIGRPLPHTRLHVLDARGNVVPVGVVGEIYLGGAGVARGYRGREALTAEQFVADSIGGVVGKRLYRTGDLGRYRADGRLEYVGRADFQIKLRGHRIEIGEIETQLESLPGVAEAAVLLLGEGADARLVGYWVAAGEEAESAASLRAQLASRLPDYMLPSSLVQMAQLPRTSNGKLDRSLLPTAEAGAVAQREYEAPQGEVEEALARLWQELLDVPRVGRHDHFFELGGHSLLAVQLASRLHESLGVEMPLKLLFGTPTLAALAAALPAPETPEPALVPVTRDQRLPLSLAQQRLWFVNRFDQQASLSYHLPLSLRLTGALDVDALSGSLARIWERHENLRSFFPDDGGVPYLDFLAPSFVMPEQDLSTQPADAQLAALSEIMLQEARAPFDFARGPLVRVRLVRLAPEEHTLLVTMHHIISDGWSLAVLVRELGALYAAFHDGQPDPLPPLPVQYADYAVWQRERTQGERLERDIAFWHEHLSGAPSLIDLPLDRPRPPIQDHRGDHILFDCPADLAPDLRAFANQHGVTLYMVLLAGWAIALSRITGQDDLVIGTPVAGRQRREVEDLIGFFVNTLALRVRVQPADTVAEMIAAVKNTTLEAFAHQDLPFEQVVEAVQPERSLSHAALAQASFTWHNEPTGGTLTLPGLTLAPIEQDAIDTEFDLSLHLTDVGDRLSGLLVYATALFERDTVARIAELLVQVLRSMVANQAMAVGALPLHAAGSQQALLHAARYPVVSRVRGERVHRRVEAWASARPEAPALSQAGEVLSYGALNAHANALAHHLRSQGLSPDQRVAIVAERGFDFVLAVLAVLKAGGAYVPLDPALPRARLAHILAECGPSSVLIQSEVEGLLPALDVPVLRLDTDLPLLARRLPQTDLADHPDADESDLCYVMYTSGSTGTPKGVMIEHPSMLNMALAHGELMGLSPCDRILQFAALSFDACAADLFMTLTHGACLHLATPEERQPGGPLERTLREQRVSVSMLPVAALAACVHEDLPELRCMVVAGDVCPPALAERWQTGRSLFNVYGPTEATVAASAHKCTGEMLARLPIGRALNNARLYVLDERQQPVPVGVVGEICIGGAGIARGYLGRPEETAVRFLPDPFHPDAGGRMYRTGDLGRWRADGALEFLGRRDQQVKIRGFRIELG
ncbi:MAG: amino acid adenylation domain-containing protein, partial [Lysobacter sp.]|nr:amino acid adenylation domain-containing protein [Lysobacter sp.]